MKDADRVIARCTDALMLLHAQEDDEDKQSIQTRSSTASSTSKAFYRRALGLELKDELALALVDLERAKLRVQAPIITTGAIDAAASRATPAADAAAATKTLATAQAMASAIEKKMRLVHSKQNQQTRKEQLLWKKAFGGSNRSK